VEGNIEETFTFYRLPKEHHKHLKSTNMLQQDGSSVRTVKRGHAGTIVSNPKDFRCRVDDQAPADSDQCAWQRLLYHSEGCAR